MNRRSYSHVVGLLLLLCLSVVSRAVGVEVAALQQLADQLKTQLDRVLQPIGATEPVLAVVVEADASLLGKEDRIAQELERLLVFRLESDVMVGRAMTLRGRGDQAVEQARVAGAGWLLRCVLGLEKNDLRLTAELSPLHVPFWDRLVDGRPNGAQAHMFATVSADEEVFTLLGKPRVPPALGNWRLTEILSWPKAILDLGLGDINGDHLTELVLLSEHSIEIFSLESDPPRFMATYDLSHLPSARTRTRDPIGNLVLFDFNSDGNAEIFFKLFNRGLGEVLAYSGGRLRALRELERTPLCVFRKDRRARVVSGLPEPGTNHFSAELEVADINESRGQSVDLNGAFSAMRCFQRSAEADLIAGLVDPSGRLFRVSEDWKQSSILSDVGAAFTVADLDGDAEPEWVLSEAAWPGQPDGVRLVSRGDLLWQSRDVVGSIVAMTCGPWHETGQTRAALAAVDAANSNSRVYLLER